MNPALGLCLRLRVRLRLGARLGRPRSSVVLEAQQRRRPWLTLCVCHHPPAGPRQGVPVAPAHQGVQTLRAGQGLGRVRAEEALQLVGACGP